MRVAYNQPSSHIVYALDIIDSTCLSMCYVLCVCSSSTHWIILPFLRPKNLPSSAHIILCYRYNTSLTEYSTKCTNVHRILLENRLGKKKKKIQTIYILLLNDVMAHKGIQFCITNDFLMAPLLVVISEC